MNRRAARQPKFADGRDYPASGLRTPNDNFSMYLVKRYCDRKLACDAGISESVVIAQ
jgi:hypothetical protein